MQKVNIKKSPKILVLPLSTKGYYTLDIMHTKKV